MARDHLERRLRRAVFSARPGRIVGPVPTQLGYYIVRVTRIHPSREIPRARAREQARVVLVSEAQQDAMAAFVDACDAK